MLKTPVTKVSKVPTGELGRRIVTVGLKRLHCTGVSYCRFEEELRSKVVFRFDVAHLHDPSSLPVHLAIAVYHWHPCWLVTWTLFRTDNNTREVAEACGWDWGSRRHCSSRITFECLGNDMCRCDESSKHVERCPRSPLPVSISRWALCQLSHGSDECHGGHFLSS